MNQERYIKAVLKKLKCSGSKKGEIRKELESDISGALENGESLEEIMERMGNPASLAGEFNDNFSKEELSAFKKRKGFLFAGIVTGVLLLLLLLVFLALPKSYPIGKSGYYTEAEVKTRTETVISYFNEENYEALQDMCPSEEMKRALSKENLEKVKNMFGEDFGEFVTYGNIYMGEVVQLGKTCAVVQVNATYENMGITFTLTFDRDMGLIGFYMK